MTDTQTPDKHDDSETEVELKIATTEEQEEIITLPGKYLAGLREEHKMSVKQVADSLHLEIRIIDTLEADDYDSGIPHIFMKGYIRSYAKLMDISPEPLITAFDTANKAEEEDKKSKSKSKSSTPKSQYKPKKQAKSNDLWPKLVTLAILLTLIIFIALWQFTPPPEEIVQDENTSKFNNFTPPVQVDETQTLNTSSPKVPDAVEQPVATPSEPPPVATPVEEPKDHTIHVNFKAKVWMRITDGTGKRLFQGVGTEGKSLTYDATPPYKVRVGNDKDVDIEYQGDTKDLKEYPKYKNRKKTYLIGGE